MPGFRMTRSDRGAASAIVAVVMAGGVVLGMATVVVDVGRLYAEREQLATGADAAAWAIAEGCVLDPDGCADQATLGEAYADDNAADRAAAASVICGTGPGLPACPAPASNRTDCLGTAPTGVSYVEVRTRTRLPDGSTLLPPAFAGALSGNEDGTEVAACARAAYGPPSQARGLGVTFSLCEWQALTDNGATFWPQPHEGTPPAEAERIVYLKDNTATACGAGPPGWDAPGGFGWLDDMTGQCETDIEVNGSYGGNTGNSPSQACQDALSALRADRQVTLIPIYDGVRSQGANITYHLIGFAGFVMTGYRLSGYAAASWLTGSNTCVGNSGADNRCLFGYFVRALVPTTGVEIGGPDLGVSIVNLVG